MFYCPGECCSKRKNCFHYMSLHKNELLQLIDMSTQGTSTAGYDREGIWHPLETKYYCGDNASAYHYFKPIETWEDKGNWENLNDSAHAEGWAVAPGSLILIENEKGEQELIPFHPKTLKLSTKVLSWHPKF